MGCGKEPGLNLVEVGDQEVFQTELENSRGGSGVCLSHSSLFLSLCRVEMGQKLLWMGAL